MIALLVTLLLLALILGRVPVAFAIFVSGVVGLLLIDSPTALMGVLGSIPGASAGNYSLAAIPLFILMAQLILVSGALDNLFESARMLVGRVRGGTGVASLAAGAVFASVSGSSTAAAAALAHTTTGKMIDEGYRPRVAGGLVAAAGTLAAMIPPSVLLVFYAIIAEASVGAILIAGVVPGLLAILALMAAFLVVMRLDSQAAPQGVRHSLVEKLGSLTGLVPVLGLFLVIVGFIYFGVTSPTEAAAVGCLGGFLLIVVRRRLRWATMKNALVTSLNSSVMIMFIIVAAHVFGHFLTVSGVTVAISDGIAGLNAPPLLIIGVICLLYLVLGFFMDQMAILALTVPLTLPVVESLGYDPIWFGIVVILLAEIGLITPPLGLNAFVVAESAKIPMEQVFRGSLPYVLALAVVGALLVIFPDLVLFLPNSM